MRDMIGLGRGYGKGDEWGAISARPVDNGVPE
jgi:hypothetical protein